MVGLQARAAKFKELGLEQVTTDSIPIRAWTPESAPLYLVDAGDTLDKIEPDKLSALAASVTEVVRHLHLLPRSSLTASAGVQGD
jgi:hypothetical protein